MYCVPHRGNFTLQFLSVVKHFPTTPRARNLTAQDTPALSKIMSEIRYEYEFTPQTATSTGTEPKSQKAIDCTEQYNQTQQGTSIVQPQDIQQRPYHKAETSATDTPGGTTKSKMSKDKQPATGESLLPHQKAALIQKLADMGFNRRLGLKCTEGSSLRS